MLEIFKLQPHLADGLEKLSQKQQEAYFAQLKAYPPSLLSDQRKFLEHPPEKKNYQPLTEYDTPGRSDELLGKGKVACLVLAGGMGTRLGFGGPKALVPITRSKKSFLQLFCERTHAASKAYGTPLRIAFMVSTLNHDLIERELKKNRYFGLTEDQVDLFCQENAPLMDDEKNWFLEAPGSLAVGPDGNGHALRKLVESGILKKWKGVEIVSVVPIDNPLADPFDASFCAYHALQKNDVSTKAVLRTNTKENIGVIVKSSKTITIVEYTEIPPNFVAPLGNIGLYCFSTAFIEKTARVTLPWHTARKVHGKKEIWKFERFILDLLPYASKCGVAVYPREDVFAPLKRAEGPDSFSTVQEMVQNFDRRVLNQITGKTAPSHPFELDPAFYYPTDELRKKWKGKEAPKSDYIKP